MAEKFARYREINYVQPPVVDNVAWLQTRVR